MSARRRWLQAGAAASLLGAGRGSGAGAAADPLAFAFGLIGDTPYSVPGEPGLAALLADTDADALAFVLHVGDLKAGGESCDDALFERRRRLLDRSAHPLVLLPGDNDWTDCHRAAAGGFDPRERLAAWRARFASTAAPLGGRAARAPLAIERQPDWPENLRWRLGDVHFVAVHVVGSNNGRDAYPGSREEFAARLGANRRWLFESLQQALDARAGALAIAFHANPQFDARPRSGLSDWIGWLREVAAAFPRPVLLLHGDSHTFRDDHPLADERGRALPHVERVEAFGWPFDASWVRIAHDPHHPARFRVSVRHLGRS